MGTSHQSAKAVKEIHEHQGKNRPKKPHFNPPRISSLKAIGDKSTLTARTREGNPIFPNIQASKVEDNIPISREPFDFLEFKHHHDQQPDKPYHDRRCEFTHPHQGNVIFDHQTKVD